MAQVHDSMMNPKIEDLLSKVDSKFTLVSLGSLRARQINSYFGHLGEGLGSSIPPQVTSTARKPLSIAFEEIAADKIVGVPEVVADDAAETALADTRLVAPADALVSVRVREAGSMVSNAAPIYTLSLQDPVYVRAYVSGPQLTKVKPGGVVTVTADGTSERFKGCIGFISPKAEFTPKSVETTELRTDLVYRVRVVLPGAAHALRQGMPVSVLVDEAVR